MGQISCQNMILLTRNRSLKTQCCSLNSVELLISVAKQSVPRETQSFTSFSGTWVNTADTARTRSGLCQDSRILLESIPILLIIYSDQFLAFLHSHDPAWSLNELGPVAFSFTAKT